VRGRFVAAVVCAVVLLAACGGDDDSSSSASNTSSTAKTPASTIPDTGKVEVHEMAMNNGVMTMRPLDKGLAIEPGKTVKLAPGGYHLMLMDLKNPLKQGEKVPLELQFEKAGKVALSLDVQGVGAQAPAGHSDGPHGMKK